ncbi:EexN family lipoprotein [Candidatus Pantoea bituminis]|uniref:EexN family lipoprotein n=1 Tax=Candidatus Pantoea bituminis TaxID=2831036 RepID=UPI001C0633F0|nr:EexN family lipoprotein [Pantoea bituminis]
MKGLIFTALAVILLAGCKDEQRDGDYYSKSLNEARSVAQKCQDEEISESSCIDAKDALFRDKLENAKVMHN